MRSSYSSNKCLRRKKNRRTKRRVTKRRVIKRTMKGGSAKTTRMTMGEATKPLHQITATRPGYPVMSGASLYRLQEDIDRNGDDMES
jgi:hypothetical protein